MTTSIQIPVSATSFTDLGAAPITIAATDIVISVIVADAQPSVGAAGAVNIHPGEQPKLFAALDASSHVWAIAPKATNVQASQLSGALGGGGGGGGGAAIQPESGSVPIKISAFPAAAMPMGPNSKVTGLDDSGANVNFTQAQILNGQNAPAASNQAGNSVYSYAGNGDGSGRGGVIGLYAGTGGASGNGGAVLFTAGAGINGGSGGIRGGTASSGNGGQVFINGGGSSSGTGGSAGAQAGNGVTGGYAYLTGGGGTVTGGAVKIATGSGNTGAGGDLEITLSPGGTHNGRLKIVGLPTASTGLTSGEVWLNSNVLTIVP